MSYKSQIIVHDETFDASGISDEQRLERALMAKPDTLTPVITHLMGGWTNQFPLLSLTEGQDGGTVKESIENIEYEYPVIGKLRTTDVVAGSDYASDDKPGLYHTPVHLIFRDKWFPFQATIKSPSGVLMRIMEEPVAVGANYRYTLQAFNPSQTLYLKHEDFRPGAIWGRVGGSTVSHSLSVGNSNPVQNPGKRRNQISIIRESYRYAGNPTNQTVEFKIFGANGPTSLYIDFENYQHMINFKRYKEEQLWISEYSRNEFGVNPLKDYQNNKIIPTGAGLFQQIRNRDTYTTLTERRIKTILGDVFRGAPDTGAMDIVVYVGTGSGEEFDTAMKNSKIFTQVAEGTASHFVRSYGGNLQLGGYFTSYRHVDGHVITLKKLPMLDHGGYADASGIHPVSGLPMSSYEMHWVDQSRYDGVPNLRYVYQKGRMEIRGIQQGMTIIPESTYGDMGGMKGWLNLATERDATSIHYLCTGGIQMLRDTHAFSLYPSAA